MLLSVASVSQAKFAVSSASVASASLLQARGEGAEGAEPKDICAKPPIGLPGYCCTKTTAGIAGARLDKEYADTCECNPGWSHEECICKAYLMKNACSHCMA